MHSEGEAAQLLAHSFNVKADENEGEPERYPPNLFITRPIYSTVGWTAFSIVFNLQNTIVWGALFSFHIPSKEHIFFSLPHIVRSFPTFVILKGTLFPKLLQQKFKDAGHESDYSSSFSTLSTITTIASALVLPLCGSLVDRARCARKTTLISQSLGLFSIALLLVTSFSSFSSSQVTLCGFSYVLAMFFLRTGVMSNNATLTFFPTARRMFLSLLQNFVGFLINLGGLSLVLLVSLPSSVTSSSDTATESFWIFLFTGLALLASFFSFLVPSDPPSAAAAHKQGTSAAASATAPSSYFSPLRESALSLKDAVVLLIRPKSKQYRDLALFLAAYTFVCSGATFTVLLSPYFLSMYDLDLPSTVRLNLIYKISMVSGVALGMLLEKRLRTVRETLTLQLHAFLYMLFLVLLFVSGTSCLSWGYTASILISCCLGVVYSWNLGVTRGMLSKLCPSDRACEISGLYSAATYLSLSATSFVYSQLAKVLGDSCMPLVIAALVLPSVPILFRLQKSMTAY